VHCRIIGAISAAAASILCAQVNLYCRAEHHPSQLKGDLALAAAFAVPSWKLPLASGVLLRSDGHSELEEELMFCGVKRAASLK